ncbi:hypothetical protein ACTPEM_25130, partial [Clostridioides difficile]
MSINAKAEKNAICTCCGVERPAVWLSESLELCDLIGKTMLNEAVKQSALIAKEYGTFSEYKYENISKS